ncbi:MAG: hypothetical protein ACI814_004687, partial [Mariniblastus sp.]
TQIVAKNLDVEDKNPYQSPHDVFVWNQLNRNSACWLANRFVTQRLLSRLFGVSFWHEQDFQH